LRKPKNGFFFGFQKLDQRQIVGVGSGNGDDVVILHFVEHSQHQAKIRDVFAFDKRCELVDGKAEIDRDCVPSLDIGFFSEGGFGSDYLASYIKWQKITEESF